MNASNSRGSGGRIGAGIGCGTVMNASSGSPSTLHNKEATHGRNGVGNNFVGYQYFGEKHINFNRNGYKLKTN